MLPTAPPALLSATSAATGSMPDARSTTSTQRCRICLYRVKGAGEAGATGLRAALDAPSSAGLHAPRHHLKDRRAAVGPHRTRPLQVKRRTIAAATDDISTPSCTNTCISSSRRT